MSSNRGSSQASRDSSNSMQDRDPGANQGRFDSVTKKVSNEVKKQLGLKDGKATNLTGKDQDFYGKEASELSKKLLAEKGYGTYNAETGSFSNVVGNRIISGNKMYGDSGTAMGSGDPTGAMTSTPISEEMLRRQNLIKGVATAGMSFAMPGVGKTLLRTEAARAFTDYGQPGEAYEDYMEGFEAKQQGKKFKSKRSVQSFAGRVVDQIKTSILGGEGDKLGD